MSSIDVLKRALQVTENKIELGYGSDFTIATAEVQKEALTEAIEALEKVGHVQAIRDRVSLINKKSQKHGDLTFECLLAFIDSLDKSDSTTN